MQAEGGLTGIAEGHSLSDEVMHADAMLSSSVKEETRESFSPFRLLHVHCHHCMP